MTKASRPPGSTLSLGAAIGVVLLLAMALLIIRSGQPSQNAGPAASSPSSSSGSSGAVSPSAGPSSTGSSSPGSSGAGSSGAGAGPQTGAGSGAQTGGNSSGSGSAATGAGTAGTAGSSGALAAGPLPNTGAPFPWWAGLLPLALGLSLFVALRQRARIVPLGASAAGRVSAMRDRRDDARYGADGDEAWPPEARDLDDDALIDRPSPLSSPETGRCGSIREGERWISPGPSLPSDAEAEDDYHFGLLPVFN